MSGEGYIDIISIESERGGSLDGLINREGGCEIRERNYSKCIETIVKKESNQMSAIF